MILARVQLYINRTLARILFYSQTMTVRKIIAIKFILKIAKIIVQPENIKQNTAENSGQKIELQRKIVLTDSFLLHNNFGGKLVLHNQSQVFKLKTEEICSILKLKTFKVFFVGWVFI